MPHIDLIVDGIRYPSVTEVLGGKPKPWLDAWREKWGVLAARKTKCAVDVGNKFHEMAEGLALNKNVELSGNKRIDTMTKVFAEWLVSENFKVGATELHVVSHIHQYQGTFDAVGYLKNKKTGRVELYLLDWKTSSGIYADMALQLAAYALAYKEETGVEIKRGMIVHVSKDKPHHKLTVKEYTLGKRLTNAFLKRLEEFRKAQA